MSGAAQRDLTGKGPFPESLWGKRNLTQERKVKVEGLERGLQGTDQLSCSYTTGSYLKTFTCPCPPPKSERGQEGGKPWVTQPGSWSQRPDCDP